MRLFLLAGTMISALSIGQASAALTYTTANGTESFPGTFIGTVGNGATNIDSIGNINNVNGSIAVVNPSHNPSIYEFYWTGGILDIQEELGNNGTETPPNGVYAALFSRTSVTDNSTPLLSSALSQFSFPYASGGTPLETVYDGSLAAGYYSLDTYAAPAVDPNYVVTFTAISSVPEPMSVGLLGAGLFGLGIVKRRRSSHIA